MTVPAGSFTIGKIQCIPISDGSCPFPPCVFFADVPDQELKARGLPTDAINSTFTCLLVSTGKNKVLIDTGAGNLAPLPANYWKISRKRERLPRKLIP